MNVTLYMCHVESLNKSTPINRGLETIRIDCKIKVMFVFNVIPFNLFKTVFHKSLF